uniref:Tumor suppressor p53 n=1 Tax=Plectus sambesii TaxID=2011161 RepID=A0A914X3D3_9BILA
MDSVMGDEDAFSSASTSPDQPMRPFSQASSDALASAVNKEVDELIAMASQSLPTTPPSSPLNEAKKKDGGARPSIFSLALVSKQLGNFWTSAKERMFGEDYWIPADSNEIAVFPADLFAAHPRMLPSKSDKEVIFSVCQGSVKNQPNMSLYHVTFAFTNEEGQTQTLSIFRSNDIQEAIDLYQSCHAC